MANPKKIGRARRQQSDRAGRLERRRALSREEILEAARRVLLREGIARTTLTAVANEAHLTKAALYYYFPSKDALLFELVFRIYEREARCLHDAVEATKTGHDALRAIIATTIERFTERLDDFRLAFLHSQVAAPGALQLGPENFARIRPLNELSYATATRRVEAELQGRSGVNPRRLVFLAQMAAIGVLTFKGMVESLGDAPLLHSDAELIEDLSRIFAAALRG
ncbi:MAG TPA: helix-turn-helix domain-containing protein [Kofleriaceae bacterium]|nr:helix-turn-helix domain-containing protein [Kofleriaceae bacterium]